MVRDVAKGDSSRTSLRPRSTRALGVVANSPAAGANVAAGNHTASTRGGAALDAAETERLFAEIEAYMAREGLRSTDQRRLIVAEFFAHLGHVSIEELLAKVRAKEPRVGYATVYRTLKMLAECGVAHERKFSDGLTRYEVALADGHHDHLICAECGQITEFEDPEIEELQRRVAERHGFALVEHKLELYGSCIRRDCPNRTGVRPP
jgi:Fur family transcriptional regulator, ferric uptake regulator